ncbi:histidine utilization repressor [Alsobacter sp. SYSU BS001988]|jgi:GntR family histidine utilization transcriptional repressor
MPEHLKRSAADLHLPRYAEIRRALEEAIMSGAWRPGRRVPSEHALMEQFGCSRMTVNKALSALAEAGLILRKRRSGSFVASPASEQTVLEIHDIPKEIAASGREHRFEILSRHRRRAGPGDAERLGVKPGAPVLAMAVRHFAAGKPFAVEDRLINLARVPEAEAEPFDTLPPGSWLLARIPWSEAEHQIRAANLDAETASRLDLAPGAAGLVVDRRTWQGGETITCVTLVYPGDRHRLTARFGPPRG